MFRMTDGFKLEEFETKSEKMKRRQNNTALVHSTVLLPNPLDPLSSPLMSAMADWKSGVSRGIKHYAGVLEPEHAVWRMGDGWDCVWAREGGRCGDLI